MVPGSPMRETGDRAMTRARDDWVGKVLSGGRYRVDAKLGEGGMGAVYRAWDHNLEADVVVKVPRRALLDDAEAVTRFDREVRALVQLAHPHVVRVADVGRHEDLPFAVMQYLPGGSLEDRAELGPDGKALPVDPAELAGWLPAVAGALDFVHARGFLHRDVKPANLLFDAHGNAYLGDFGVTKALAEVAGAGGSRAGLTGTGLVLGTPEYLAPELVLGEPADGRADQYALAITLYEQLCGRRPFESETPTAVLVLQTTKAPDPLDALRPGLGRALSAAILKALAKDPTDRFPSCAAFSDAVLAASAEAGGPDEPLKLRCPACGRTLKLPVSIADASRWPRPRRASCPRCAAALLLSAGGAELANGNNASASGIGLASGPLTLELAGPGPAGKTRLEPVETLAFSKPAFPVPPTEPARLAEPTTFSPPPPAPAPAVPAGRSNRMLAELVLGGVVAASALIGLVLVLSGPGSEDGPAAGGTPPRSGSEGAGTELAAALPAESKSAPASMTPDPIEAPPTTPSSPDPDHPNTKRRPPRVLDDEPFDRGGMGRPGDRGGMGGPTDPPSPEFHPGPRRSPPPPPPEADPGPPPLSWIDRTFDARISSGYFIIRGKVRNASDRPIRGLSANITAEVGNRRRAVSTVGITPPDLAPGETGSYFRKESIVRSQAVYPYEVEFRDGEGRPVAAVELGKR